MRRDEPFKKNLLKIIFFSFILLLFPKIPFQIGLILVLFSIGITTLQCPFTALISISFMQVFSGLVRWKNPENIMLAGFRTEIILVFLFIFLLHLSILKKKRFLPAYSGTTQINKTFSRRYRYIIFLFILWIIIRTIAGSINIIGIFLIIRESILVLLLFFAVISILHNKIYLSKYILLSLCLGSSCVAVINLIHYFYGLPLPWPPVMMAPNTTDIILYRSFSGIIVPRMRPLLGGIGPGGAAAFYASMAMCSLCCMNCFDLKKSLKIVMLISFCTLITAACCTLSYSLLLCVFLGFWGFSLKLRKQQIKIIGKFFICCFFFILFYGNFISVTINGNISNSLIVYFWKNIISIYHGLMSHGISEFLFGFGMSVRTGSLIEMNQNSQNEFLMNLADDQWWFVVINQLGIIGFVLAVLIIVPALVRSIRKISSNSSVSNYMFCATVLLISLCGFVHGFPLFDKPHDFAFAMALAIIYKYLDIPNIKDDFCERM